jgi:hypothetical protein
MNTSISKSKARQLIAIVAALTTGVTVPSWANSRVLSTAERASNTYKTYLPGQVGCVDDLGYGRIKQGCE